MTATGPQPAKCSVAEVCRRISGPMCLDGRMGEPGILEVVRGIELLEYPGRSEGQVALGVRGNGPTGPTHDVEGEGLDPLGLNLDQILELEHSFGCGRDLARNGTGVERPSATGRDRRKGLHGLCRGMSVWPAARTSADVAAAFAPCDVSTAPM